MKRSANDDQRAPDRGSAAPVTCWQHYGGMILVDREVDPLTMMRVFRPKRGLRSAITLTWGSTLILPLNASDLLATSRRSSEGC